MRAFWICMITGLFLFSAMIYSIIFYRRSAKPTIPLEAADIIWSLLPILMMILMVIPAIRVFMDSNKKEDKTQIKMASSPHEKAQQIDQMKEDEVNKLWALEALMKQGEQVYSRVCAGCHQSTGMGSPPPISCYKR